MHDCQTWDFMVLTVLDHLGPRKTWSLVRYCHPFPPRTGYPRYLEPPNGISGLGMNSSFSSSAIASANNGAHWILTSGLTPIF